MKNHLKRVAAPKSWMIDRKANTFISRPKPGAHQQESSLPLGVIIRDFLKFTATMGETKKMLKNKQVLVDGRRRKEHRLPVGLFDVLSFPEINKHFRFLLDKKGRADLKEISAAESNLKPCKLTGKKMVSGKIQLNFHDGRNILADKELKGKIGDTIIIGLPDQKIKEVLELKKEAFVFLVKGKHSGDYGILQEIKEEQATYQRDNQMIKTLKEYIFVLGDKKPAINIKLENKA